MGVVAFPGIVLALANLGLYLADFGINTSFILAAPRASPVQHYLNPKADFPYARRDLRGPEPRGFDLPKPPNAFRVVVVGESSVQGYPYSSELAFPRQMQMVLERQLPDRQVEVLNAGIVGVSTRLLVDVVQHILTADPDLIVIYAGHNEFYGVGGVATKASVALWQVNVRRYRLAQALMGEGTETGSGGELISSLPRELEIPRDSPLVGLAEQNYAQNIAAIVELSERAQVPLLLCSVASNLRDHSPRLRRAESRGHRSDGLAPGNLIFTEGRILPEAVPPSQLNEACRLDPDNAVLHYRLAQALENAGDRAGALDEYVKARDCDVCRFRAPSSFREILSRIAAERSSSNVRFFDLTTVFEQAAEYPAPGSDLFLEHVHFNLEGHWLVARSVGRYIIEEFVAHDWRPDAVPTSRERDDWLGVIPEDQVTAHFLAWFLMKSAPFDRAVDAKRHQADLAGRIQALFQSVPEDQQRRLFSLPNATKTDDLVDGVGRALLEEGRTEEALELFQTGRRRRPWMPNSAVFAAVSLHRLGRDREAVEVLQEADRACLPPNPALMKVLADLEARLPTGQFERGH